MPGSNFSEKGSKQLEKQMLTLSLKTGITMLRRSGKAAMEPTRKQMKKGANYDGSSDEKHMRDSITTTTKKGSRTSKTRAMRFDTGPARAHNQKAIAQEFGTAKQAAKPFVRPAGRKGAGLAIPILRRQFIRELNRVR